MDLVALDAQLKANEYLEETVVQLEKDFLMVGINFDIIKPVKNYTQLFEFTSYLVNALNEKDPTRILNLLYRIDLSEEKVKETMQVTELTFNEMLAELIVKRELYKVVLRKKYSS